MLSQGTSLKKKNSFSAGENSCLGLGYVLLVHTCDSTYAFVLQNDKFKAKFRCVADLVTPLKSDPLCTAFQRCLTGGEKAICCLLTVCTNPVNAMFCRQYRRQIVAYPSQKGHSVTTCHCAASACITCGCRVSLFTWIGYDLTPVLPAE